MSIKYLSKLCVSLLLSVAASSSFADVMVWDYSPATTGGTVTNDYWTNQYPGQHFADNVSFAAATIISGMDIYNAADFGNLGDVAHVTIWADNSNAPGAIIADFLTTVTAIDSVGAYAGEHRMHADISGFSMAAGTTYWIGMAPSTALWTQTGLNGVAGGDGRMAFFIGSAFNRPADIGDMAFRLYATDGTVPEPASMALFGLALLGLGAARRRRK